MRFFAGLVAVGLVLSVAGTAGADSTGWSDNFNGGAQQAWVFANYGTASTALFQNNRLEMSTSVQPPMAALAGFVAQSYTDVLMQSRIQVVDTGDNYLAYLLARANPTTMSSYVLGVGSPGGGGVPHLWLGKLTNGVYSGLAALDPQPLFNWTDCQAEFEVIGNTLRGKVWSFGSAEPDWQIQTTDNSYAGGMGGVMVAAYPGLGWTTAHVAFDDVSATAVPEPVTMAGLMLGIGGLVGYVRKRRKA